VVCVGGDTPVAADKRAANNKVRGMKLLTQEMRKKLPPLYSQDGKGGKAVAYLKLFTPDSSFSWFLTYAELHISQIMWSSGLCGVTGASPEVTGQSMWPLAESHFLGSA